MSDPTAHVAELADDFVHDLLSADKALIFERHCAACEECQAALAEARRRRAALQAVPPVVVRAQMVENTVRAVETHVQTRRLRVKRVFKWLTATAAAAAVILGAFNLHYLRMEASPYDLVVLGQSDLVISSWASMRVRLMDRKANKPLEGVPVTVTINPLIPGKEGGGSFQLASFKTDANGVGQPRFYIEDTVPGDFDMIVQADVPDKREVVTQRVRLVSSRRVLLTSDKPVYQPGQTIHMRALALNQPAGKPVGQEKATITVADAKGNIIFKQQSETSQFGITAADCALADEIVEGNYTLSCLVGATESRMAVAVSKYVLPKIKLAVEFDKPYYQPGDKARCTIRADYFFGKPVADAEVRIEVRNNGTLLPLDTIPIVRTGRQGDAVLDMNTADLIPLQNTDENETKLSFSVTGTDSAGQKQSSDMERLVTRRPVRIEVIPEGGTLVRNVMNKVYILTTTADGKPTPARLHISGNGEREVRTNDLGLASFFVKPVTESVKWTFEALGPDDQLLAERTFEADCGASSGDFLLRLDRAVYRGGDTMKVAVIGSGSEPVIVEFFKSDGTRRLLLSETIEMKDGNGKKIIDLPPDLTGTLLMLASRLDGRDDTVHKTRVVYVQPPDQLRLRMVPASGAKAYRPRAAEKLNLTLTDADGTPTPGAFGLAAVDEAVFSVQGTIANNSPFDGMDRGLLQPVFALYPWSPDLARRLGKDDVQELEQALFSTTVSGSTIEYESRDRFGLATTRERAVNLYTLHGDTYAEKVERVTERRAEWRGDLYCGWIALLIGVSLLCYAGVWVFVNTPEVKRLHQGVLMILAPAAFLLVTLLLTRSGLKDTSNTFSYAGGQVKGSGGSGPVFLDASGSMQPVVRFKNILREGIGINGIQGVTAGAEDVTPFIREQFPETLLWRPQVITDDEGKASVDLTFADSITTWRLSATAVDAAGRLGAGELPLRVVRPFFVDFNLPVSLTRNDEVSVPVVVHNYTDKSQTVTLTLSDVDWFARSGGPEKPLVVAPGKVAAAHYRITAKRAGTFTIEVRADGQGVADALKRNIEIVPDGLRKERVVNGSLDRPAVMPLTIPDGVIDGSVRAQVKLYPSSFSQLLEGLDGIFRLPSGCFEQTSSSLYPNILALDYLKRTGQDRPKVADKAKRYIHAGNQRLLGFEVNGGGFSWYGKSPAVRTLTAYGLMEFTDMARVYNVDLNLIERTRGWLLSQRRHDGSWLADGHDLGRGGDSQHTATAYIAWAVFDNGAAADQGKPTLDYLLRRKPADVNDPYSLALLCNALLALDPTGDKAGPYLDRLETLKQTDAGRFAWWKRRADERTLFYGAGDSADVETTALTVLALLKAKRPGSSAAALSWLASKKDAHGTWGTTQATVLSLKALLAGTKVVEGGEKTRIIEVKLGDKLLETFTIRPDQAEVMQQFDLTKHLTPGQQTLTLTETTGTASGYQVTLRYHVDGQAVVEPDRFFDIELTYDRTNVAMLDMVRAKARIVNRKPAPAEMVMLDLPVPPGFVPLTDDLEALQRDGKVAKFSVETGKIVVYLREIRRERPLEVSYRLQAVQPVKALSPGARVYEYYAPERGAMSVPVVLTVK